MTVASLPPMSGTYRIQSGVLRFEPHFPLEPGVTYRAVFRPDQLQNEGGSAGEQITTVFQTPPRKPTQPTVVRHIYPSAEILPENLLKFYVHFSAPMSRGRIYEHINLRDESGKQVELPFLEIDEELWDPAMMRLTLFIDPGRIKRGVRPLEDVGPALEEGKSYTLVIGHELRDGAGNPLKEAYQKLFKVGAPDREPPDPAQWKLQPPKPGSRESFTVRFPEPMDHALSQRIIRVTGESGESVEGETALEDQERRWVFTPSKPWRPGSYKLVVQTTIEDLAGNNIGKPFDVDLFEGVQRRLSTSTVQLPFEVR
ncbi:MAG: Ig-like domain-containing protein [Acidobacteria bacterium]|nr:Ig-like domain-containing protein [Acidobacteriota bacterium]